MEPNEVVPVKSPRTRAAYPRKSHGRSRLTNGHGPVLPDVDGRSLIARRYKDICAAIYADQGGVDQCSESRQQLIRRFAAASVLAEQLESKLANGEDIDIVKHALLCSTLTRLSQRNGINRIPRDVTPSLNTYLARKVQDEAEAEVVMS
jgi:hypothetical protein